jgi:hypothetical protein
MWHALLNTTKLLSLAVTYMLIFIYPVGILPDQLIVCSVVFLSR